MKAYAVLDGGGVKGAALAGCLEGARECGIDFVGYGGTSAGSIVALLASVGYSPTELGTIMSEEIDFADFLDDRGTLLSVWQKAIKRLLVSSHPLWAVNRTILSLRKQIDAILRELGLYSGNALERKLRKLVVTKHPQLGAKAQITFSDLRNQGCAPLKIVAANLKTRKAIVMGEGYTDGVANVLTAVRASCSYPFLFRPVMMHRDPLVDGGLASNLPVWLFSHERERDGCPLVAFDLTTDVEDDGGDKYDMSSYAMDMISTALESSDALLQEHTTKRFFHIQVPIPSRIETLDFDLPTAERRYLFNEGQRASQTFFLRRFGSAVRPLLQHASGRFDAIYGDEATFSTALGALIRDIQRLLPHSSNPRACIMLPAESAEEFTITFQVGMETDPDQDLKLPRFSGPPGDAMRLAAPIIADWATLRTSSAGSPLPQSEIKKIPPSRRATAAVPIFDLRRPMSVVDGLLTGTTVAGALCVDCAATPADAEWVNTTGQPNPDLLNVLKRWADVIGRMLN